MNYLNDSQLIGRAVQLTAMAQEGDVDVHGSPCLYHSLRVMFTVAEQNAPDYAVAASVLHDVIEDHAPEFTERTLIAEGIGYDTICILRLLNRNTDRTRFYQEYIDDIIESKNFWALNIKKMDLWDNLCIRPLLKDSDDLRRRYEIAFEKIQKAIYDHPEYNPR